MTTWRERGSGWAPALGRTIVGRPWIAYLVLTVLAFPILEMIASGEHALQYAHDVFDDDVPRLYSIAADWRAFGPSLWDPHLTAGNPLFAQFALPPLAPDVLLSFVVPPFAAYALNAALMVFLAGFGMHVFLRDSARLPAIACFAGGILASLAFWHYIYGYAALLLPVGLWSADRVVNDGPLRRPAVLGGVVLVAFLALSSQIQIVVLDGIVAGLYVLATAGGVRRWPVRLGRLAMPWVGGALLAAPVLVSQVIALPDSQRSIWDLVALFGTLGTAIPEAIRRYSGTLFGVSVASGIGGPVGVYGSYFPGTLALPFLALGLAIPRPTMRERFLLALLLAIPIADLAAIAFVPIQEHLGALSTFQFVRVRHLFPVVATINAAYGVAWLARHDPIGSLGRRRRVIAGGLVAGALAAGALGTIVAVRHAIRPAAGLSVANEGWRLAAVAGLGGIAILALVVLGTMRSRHRWATSGAITAGLAACLLAGLAGERLISARAERDLEGSLGTWAEAVAPTPAQAFIAAQPAGGRVLSIGDDANRALAAGLDAIDGYQTIYPLRYHALFGVLTEPHLAIDPAMDRYFNGWGNRAYAFGPEIDRPVADLLGVRWLYVRGQKLTDPAFQARFTSGDVTVYENAEALPRTFIVHSSSILPDASAVVSALAAASATDLRNEAFVTAADVGPVSLPPAIAQSADTTDTATIEPGGPDQVKIDTRANRQGLLILADTFDDGWTATVDGSPAPIVPVDLALRGVPIPAGNHVVTFLYRPIGTIVGFALSGLTVLILAAWVLRDRVQVRSARTKIDPAASS